MKLSTAFFITLSIHGFMFFAYTHEVTKKMAKSYSQKVGVSKIKARLVYQERSRPKKSVVKSKKKVLSKKSVTQRKVVDQTKSKESKGSNNKLSFYLSKVREVIVKNKYKNRIAQKLNLKGIVKVSFEITSESKILSLKVLKSSNIPPLDESAITTINKVESFPKIPIEVAMKKIPVELEIVYE